MIFILITRRPPWPVRKALYFIDQNITACDQLDDPLHGSVSTPDGIVFEATATYSCESGFELEGESTATCQADGTWSSLQPQCLRICKHTDKLLEFRWVQIALIYFYTATKGISWILLIMIIKLMLSRLLIRLPGTSMTF